MQSGYVGTSKGEASDSALTRSPGTPRLTGIVLPVVASTAHQRSISASRNQASIAKAGKRRSWGRVLLVSVIIGVLAGLAAGGYWGYQRARATLATYHQVSNDVRALESLKSANFTAFTVTDADRVHGEFVRLQSDVDRLDTETTLPSHVAPIVVKLPYLGPRYTAGRQMIRVARMLAGSGVDASEIGQQALQAYKTTGLASSTAPAGPTWLDVANQRMPDIVRIKDQVDQAMKLRAQIDERVFPPSAQSRLSELDRLATSHRLDDLVDTQLPALQAAFGGDGPARYLVLIQNPSELRPSGGFPGTIAIVTFDRGQLRGYEFYDVYDLNLAYTSHTHQPVPQPWALSKYAPSPELSILDASWWSDFPTSASTIMQMYQSTGWPPIKGVIALDPAVVGAMLQITGPMTIDVDGEMRTITAANVHDEIERQRRLARDGQKTQDVHKQVVAIIGKNLIEQFKSGDRSTTLKMVRAIQQTARDRDLQVYSSNPTVQTLIEQRQWAGQIVPISTASTLAITFANVAFGKSSELMNPSYTLTLGPVVGGTRQARLDISVVHTGSPNDDPFYSGFQRWWVDVTLPQGSRRTASSVPDVPNPDEPNGGSYAIPLMPGASAKWAIDFTLPDTSSILIRRQPGLHTARVTVIDQACGSATGPTALSADLTVQLAHICSAR